MRAIVTGVQTCALPIWASLSIIPLFGVLVAVAVGDETAVAVPAGFGEAGLFLAQLKKTNSTATAKYGINFFTLLLLFTGKYPAYLQFFSTISDAS
jgi:hypothetical protein